MALIVVCPCGKKLKVRDELAGKKVKCPGCGQSVTAPAPVIVEPAGEEVMAGEPPVVAATVKPAVDDDDVSSTDVSASPAWTTSKKKKSAPSTSEEGSESKKRDDEDDDEDKPGPHWVFPGAFSTEVMALARDGIWFASLKEDVLKKAKRQLKEGEQPAKVLGEKAYIIPWPVITSIFCNRKVNGFQINYTQNDESTTKFLTPGDIEERDKIFKAIEKYLGDDWARKTVKHTPLTATMAPFLSLLITFAITIVIAIVTLFLEGGAWTGTGRGAIVALLLNVLGWLGPLGTCGIGFLIGMLFIVWMAVRMMNPPIEVTLAPVPPGKKGDD
jgi:hypothetical protein